VDLTGPGSYVPGFQGAVVAKSCSLIGGFAVHFDEILMRRGPYR
jgi:hypothetical protein